MNAQPLVPPLLPIPPGVDWRIGQDPAGTCWIHLRRDTGMPAELYPFLHLGSGILLSDLRAPARESLRALAPLRDVHRVPLCPIENWSWSEQQCLN